MAILRLHRAAVTNGLLISVGRDAKAHGTRQARTRPPLHCIGAMGKRDDPRPPALARIVLRKKRAKNRQLLARIGLGRGVRSVVRAGARSCCGGGSLGAEGDQDVDRISTMHDALASESPFFPSHSILDPDYFISTAVGSHRASALLQRRAGFSRQRGTSEQRAVPLLDVHPESSFDAKISDPPPG